ncbi:signal peptidase I [Lacticaseibacillus chiayiensis]|uniref:Signal peptidase I n=1 Tax=Lacticaseibacillus chiayiensis TaxID=2100821 RepID=A0A4Q1TW81_9LACO|nr:signal peptidase I [Lacticaseibacillus chiayiensis]QVI34973.1 signal peptidase I [Lacticaseibacillus chiayiensis]RXT22707.1 signal peptidase I [Lacticaseibacillus chiayiensis]UYN56752.1 signal peptidase I [Lacticaseibacillus chiayiensis]
MKNNNHSALRTILEFLLLFVVVFFASQLLMRYVLSKDVVQGTSMQPTLENNERLYSVRIKKPKRNDIVVIHAPDRPKALYIKRVIGMPGDTVSSKNDKLYINGKVMSEPYLNHKFERDEINRWASQQGLDPSSIKFTNDFNIKTLSSTRSAKVPAGKYFVMGDNRLVSHDSRDFGFVDKSKIQSVVVWRYWPLNRMKIF